MTPFALDRHHSAERAPASLSALVCPLSAGTERSSTEWAAPYKHAALRAPEPAFTPSDPVGKPASRPMLFVIQSP
jgi:hypothetical protein